MGLKFLDAGGSGTTADAVECVNYATMMYSLWVSSGGTRGANVRMTSNSWGGGAFSQVLLDAIIASANAPAGGMLFIAAAGNSSPTTTPAPTTHPAITRPTSSPSPPPIGTMRWRRSLRTG
jgi:hypothetical protein